MWNTFDLLILKPYSQFAQILLSGYRNFIRDLRDNVLNYCREHQKLFEIISETPLDENASRETLSSKIKISDLWDIITRFEYTVKNAVTLLGFGKKNFGNNMKYAAVLTGIVGGIGLSSCLVFGIIDIYANDKDEIVSGISAIIARLLSVWKSCKTKRRFSRGKSILTEILELNNFITSKDLKRNVMERINARKQRIGFESDDEFIKEYSETAISKFKKINKQVSRLPSFVQNSRKKRGTIRRIKKFVW